MRLAVFSHKPCWPSTASPSGYATDGGFPFQMSALSELFDLTTLLVPCAEPSSRTGEVPLTGQNLFVVPLTPPSGRGLGRKIGMGFWCLRNAPTIFRELWRADAVHAPIPGDIGTIGMLFAFLMRKPLFVRHCGNWFKPVTKAEQFWKWFMETFAGGNRVMLATGGAVEPPSENQNVRWIFSTTLRESELRACQAGSVNTDRRKKLIIVCRQDRKKGTDIVIQSLPTILSRFSEVSLDVVGDGPSLPEFQELSKQLGVNTHVTFHGKVDHDAVVGLLKQADIFCYPTSASEGFPKVVLEALACGLPVVTTRVSVLPELIGSGAGELLSEPAPVALAKAVCDILSNNEIYQRMSQCAHETAAKYSLEEWRDQIAETLRSAWGKLRKDDAQVERTLRDENTPLDVCFLAGTLGRGGAERQLIYMLKALKDAGVRTRLLCLTQGEGLEKEIRALGVEVTFVGSSRWKVIRLYRILQELRRKPADILQSAHFYTNLYVGVAGRLLRIKSIGAIRNDLTSELASNGIMGWGQLHVPEQLIANSELARARAVAKGIQPDRIHFVPNVVEVTALENQETSNGNNNGNGHGINAIRILFAARLTEQKRPDRFLRTLQTIASRRPELKFKATIIGDGPLRGQLESQTKNSGLSNQVKFLGELDDLSAYYKATDILVLTSDWEGTPNVLLEAMGHGIPVVATRVGGVSGLVHDGENGFLAERGKDDELTDSVEALLQDSKLRSAMGDCGRRFVIDKHSTVRLPAMLTNVYTQI